MYVIPPQIHKNARELGVSVYPSDNPKYKIEVYDSDGIFMFRLGASGYSDYNSYIRDKGKEFADKRKKAYESRHKKEIQKTQSRGWFAYKLLWT
jgi:hypothetical protein